MQSPASSILWGVLLAAVCSALPQRRLSKYISHFDVADYDKASVHDAHTDFTGRWKAGNTDKFEFTLSIQSHGRLFKLELHPDEEVFSSGAQFVDAHGKPFELNRASVVVGRVAGDPTSFVHGSILGGRFRGVITAHGEKYTVDPALAHFKDAQKFHSVMYKDSDVAHDKLLQGWNNSVHTADGGDSDDASSETWARNHYAQGENLKKMLLGQARHRSRRAIDPKKLECRINIAGDQTYSAEIARLEALRITDLGRIRAGVVQSFAAHVREANSVLRATKIFPKSTAAEGYQLAILTAGAYVNVEEMKKFRSGTVLAQAFQSPGNVLTDWSKADWSGYCLSYLFSHRDYDNNVLGLAYVKRVCSAYRGGSTLNTGIVTGLNAGQPLPLTSMALVFTHEVGHNWGSKHDEAKLGAECIPSDVEGGRYIMNPHANSGHLRNHRRFSPCTTKQFAETLNERSGCLQVISNGSICGNNVKDDKEQCDCGSNVQCKANDLCCNVKTTGGAISTADCKRRTGSACAIQDGPCCVKTGPECGFTPPTSTAPCNEKHECRQGTSTCDGTSAVCPRAASKPDLTLCNRKRSTCFGGECNGSICALGSFKDCFCSGIDSCSVCCMVGKTCTPLSAIKTINSTGLARHRAPGAPCEDYDGSCNFLHFCRRLDDTTLIFQVANALLDLTTIDTAWAWAKVNWYYVLLGFLGLILFFSLIIHFFAKKTPRTVEVARSRRPKSAPQTENLTLVHRGQGH